MIINFASVAYACVCVIVVVVCVCVCIRCVCVCIYVYIYMYLSTCALCTKDGIASKTQLAKLKSRKCLKFL